MRTTDHGKNYLLYTRCSTDEQAKKGNSHEYQTDGIRRSGAVSVGNLHEVGAYSDTVTGTKFDNRDAGLDAAYRLCERARGKVTFVFVYRWDRFGRSVEHCFAAIRKFREVGVEVNCPDEWIDYTDPSWPLILSVKFGMAQSESMRISDRTKDGIHAAQMAGFYTANAPVGYRKGAEVSHGGKMRRVLEPDEKADTVRRCFEQYAAGETKAELFQQYRAALGVAKSQFCRMFHNPAYCGLVQVKAHREQPATVVQGLHAPIISRDLYEACQRVLEAQQHTTKGKTWTASTTQQDDAPFYLKGVIKCPNTGRNMTAYRSRGKSGRYFPYYASQGKGGIRIPADKAHRVVGAALSGLTIGQEHYETFKAEAIRLLSERNDGSAKRADAARRGLERTTARIETIKTEYADGNISAKEYRELRAVFDADAVRLQSDLITAQSEQAEQDFVLLRVLELLRGIDTVFAAANPAYKNRILKAVFPEGFTILEGEKVRTPCVNQIIAELCGESTVYALVQNENGTTFASRPVEGGRPDRYRTHLNALKMLFAA